MWFFETNQITNEKLRYFDSCMYMFLQITTWFETIGDDLSLFSKQMARNNDKN